MGPLLIKLRMKQEPRSLRQRILESGFVIAGGREGEQMLHSFAHACHAPDRSLGCRAQPSRRPPLFLFFFFSPPPPLVVSVGYFARVCVAVKIHLASGADLSQVAENPVAVVMRVTTNCQAPHTAR